ncbi:MAG: hypothetical protein R3D85_05075 [Paracoccaceae bacterium]
MVLGFDLDLGFGLRFRRDIFDDFGVEDVFGRRFPSDVAVS